MHVARDFSGAAARRAQRSMTGWAARCGAWLEIRRFCHKACACSPPGGSHVGAGHLASPCQTLPYPTLTLPYPNSWVSAARPSPPLPLHWPCPSVFQTPETRRGRCRWRSRGRSRCTRRRARRWTARRSTWSARSSPAWPTSRSGERPRRPCSPPSGTCRLSSASAYVPGAGHDPHDSHDLLANLAAPPQAALLLASSGMLGGSACTSKLHACGRCHARARSRVRSLEQLQLTGARINARALAADPRVLAFYAELG